jgi:hypothetical protein
LPPRRGDIELVGWLEVHLDLAEAVVVAGFNDGHIPRAVMGDAFLPDSLRRALGLTCNAKRFARDAYVLKALRHSCRDLRIVTGHRTADGDALAPSRLLLAADREQLPDRVLRLCGEADTFSIRWPAGVPAAGDATSFTVPPLPGNLELPTHMSVTDFGAYLDCPYRFALKRILGLKPVRHEVVEMDAATFGGLAHEILLAFAADAEVAGSSDPERIADYLVQKLRAVAVQRFGRNPQPAVRVQIARLARRLRSFAEFQAAHRGEGWVVREAEIMYPDRPLDVSGQDPMPIRGRIDRIDQNEITGAWLIADYKTSETGESPHEAHHGRKTLRGELAWKNLQLPLYRFLAERHGVTGDVTLGYIVLPKRPDGVELLRAEWSEDQIANALEQARIVVRDIRAGRFEPNPDYRHRYDDFDRICQTMVFGSETPREAES